MDGWMEGSKQSMKGGKNKERKGKEIREGKGGEEKKETYVFLDLPPNRIRQGHFSVSLREDPWIQWTL